MVDLADLFASTFLFSPLKMRFQHKANELLLWAHFLLFSPTLYFPHLHTCSFKSTFQLFPNSLQPFLSPSLLSSISFMLLSGVRPIRLRVLWESWAIVRAALSQITPLRSHSWPRGLNIERELGAWQSGEKNKQRLKKIKRKEGKIDSDNTLKGYYREGR